MKITTTINANTIIINVSTDAYNYVFDYIPSDIVDISNPIDIMLLCKRLCIEREFDLLSSFIQINDNLQNYQYKQLHEVELSTEWYDGIFYSVMEMDNTVTVNDVVISDPKSHLQSTVFGTLIKSTRMSWADRKARKQALRSED